MATSRMLTSCSADSVSRACSNVSSQGRGARTPVAIALPLDLLGVKSINTRDRPAPDFLLFSGRYAQRLNVLLHFDMSPHRYKPFSSASERVFSLATRNQTTVSNPERESAADLVARPLSIIRPEYTARLALSLRTPIPKRSRKGEPRQHKSSKTTYALSPTQTSSTPSRNSDTSEGALSQPIHHGRSPTNIFDIPPPGPVGDDTVFSRP